MSLREEQKKKRRAKVMASMKSFLARNSFDDLTMDRIAAASRLSVGTLYNYFGGKEALTIAFCHDQMSEFFESARKLVESPPDSAERAYGELLSVYLRGFASLDRALINFIIRIAIESQLEGRSRPDFQLHAFSQLREITRKLKQKGSLPESAQEDTISFILFGLCTDLLFQYSLCGDVDIDTQIERLEKCINLIYNGLGAGKNLAGPRAGKLTPAE